MKRTTVLVLLCLSFNSCVTPPVVKSRGEVWITKINKVCIKSIDFYSDKNFFEPAKPHWYMEEARDNFKSIAKRKLAERGFELLEDCAGNDKDLQANVDLCIIPGLVVGFYLRIRVYYQDKLLCEISGNTASPANREAIVKAQEKLADKLIAIFAEKIQYQPKK